ncbi:Release factor glutamine methyltransferase [Streptomyces sp. enrichment culture]|uniref:HemK2/MTQ2 family protein methyltransferase n=1 Tax=Streptomyces sp. enrichment culture TaxID=1795815 RepID=UPI003F57EF3C
MPGYPGAVKPLVPPGVYAPQEDTDLLVGALLNEPLPHGAHVLDVGTGSGALAIEAARRGTRVTAVDVSWRAVCTTRLNARLARLPIAIRRGNLFTPVRGESFDLILANPPYVPTPDKDRAAPRGAARSWDAGRNGRLILDRICREAPTLLRPGGVLLIVHSALSCPDLTLTHLRGAGLKATVTRRLVIPYGPVLRSREGWLRERGLLSGPVPREELVVVRAEVPV